MAETMYELVKETKAAEALLKDSKGLELGELKEEVKDAEHNMYYKAYSNGVLFGKEGDRVCFMNPILFDRYLKLEGVIEFGMPVTNSIQMEGSEDCYVLFEHVGLFMRQGRTVVLREPAFTVYVKTGLHDGFLGYPLGEERNTGKGYATIFDNGAIYKKADGTVTAKADMAFHDAYVEDLDSLGFPVQDPVVYKEFFEPMHDKLVSRAMSVAQLEEGPVTLTGVEEFVFTDGALYKLHYETEEAKQVEKIYALLGAFYQKYKELDGPKGKLGCPIHAMEVDPKGNKRCAFEGGILILEADSKEVLVK